MFAAKRLKVSPSSLTLEQLDAGLIRAGPGILDRAIGGISA
jgi:hypothetical protein